MKKTITDKIDGITGISQEYLTPTPPAPKSGRERPVARESRHNDANEPGAWIRMGHSGATPSLSSCL